MKKTVAGGIDKMMWEEGSSWRDLQDDVVGMIAERLDILDHINFRTVCKPWNHAVVFGRYLPKPPQRPWLMLAGEDDNGEDDVVGYLDIFTMTIYKTRRRWRKTEATDSWWVDGNQIHVKVVKNNPVILFSGHVEEDEEGQGLYHFPINPTTTPGLITNVTLVRNASIMMMAIISANNSKFCSFSLAKAGDASWAPLRPKSWKYDFEVTVIYNEFLYAFGDEGKVECWDITTTTPKLISFSWLMVNFNPPRDYASNWYDCNYYFKFFVPTADTLLLVCLMKCLYNEDIGRTCAYMFSYYGEEIKTTEILVFKLNNNNHDHHQWNQIWSLGGDSIFVDDSTAMLIDIGSLPHPGLRDRIFITRKTTYAIGKYRKYRTVVMSFDLVQRKYEDNILIWPEMFNKSLGWFMPTFK